MSWGEMVNSQVCRVGGCWDAVFAPLLCLSFFHLLAPWYTSSPSATPHPAGLLVLIPGAFEQMAFEVGLTTEAGSRLASCLPDCLPPVLVNMLRCACVPQELPLCWELGPHGRY